MQNSMSKGAEVDGVGGDEGWGVILTQASMGKIGPARLERLAEATCLMDHVSFGSVFQMNPVKVL